MSKPIWDMEDGEILFPVSNNMAMDFDGNMMMRMSDNMAMNMDSGDIHFVSSWSNDDDEE